MFISRRRNGSPDRFLLLKLAILFLAAGVWLAGVVTDRREVTAVGLGIMVIGVLVNLVTRRLDER